MSQSEFDTTPLVMLTTLVEELSTCDPADPQRKQKLARVFWTYRVFHDRFIPWMTAVHLAVKSTQAKRATRDTLICDVRHDHPALLRAMYGPLAAWRSLDRSADLEPYLAALDRLTASHGFYGLAAVAALETASTSFVPWLEAAAPELGVTDTRYLAAHGLSDGAATMELNLAVQAEATHWPGEADLTLPIGLVSRLVLNIFEQPL